MKNPLYAKQGFELVFGISLIVIFILPAVVFGQDVQKRTEIIIQNGDTTVNGKRMKDMTAAERKDAQGIFNEDGKVKPHFRIDEKGRFRAFGLPKGDSLHAYTFKIDTGRNGNVRAYTYSYRGPRDRMPRMNPDMRNYRMPVMRERDSMRQNTFTYRMPDGNKKNYRYTPHNEQNFNFNNVDKNGITTHIRISVVDANAEEAKTMGVSKADLDLTDLTLTPEFSTGKILLMFTLDTKTSATVQFSLTDGKIIWTDKASNGSFSKNFSLPANGVYLLKVQQGNKTVVKRIVKE